MFLHDEKRVYHTPPTKVRTAKEQAIWLTQIGLSTIPLSPGKKPAVKWKPSQAEKIDPNKWQWKAHLGIVCGAVSGGLECIDVDCKHDLTGDLWRCYSSGIKKHLPDLWPRLAIQETVNGGYHILYTCKTIEGNKKLASREATESEKEKHPQEKVKVLIETRGEGGYICADPSPDYTLIQGSWDSIPSITQKERETLFELAGGFHTMPQKAPQVNTAAQAQKPLRTPVISPTETGKGKEINGERREWFNAGKGADYVLDLLMQNGWTEAKRDHERVYVKRPGETSTEYSGNIRISDGKLMVFSTSTEFEAEVGYDPFGVWCVLEHGDNYPQAMREVRKIMGGNIPSPEKAPSYSFIKRKPKTDKETGEVTYTMDGIKLREFAVWLSEKGFFKRLEGDKLQFIHIENNLAEIVQPSQIKDYVKKVITDDKVLGLVVKDPRLFGENNGLSWLDNAPDIEGKDPEKAALFYFGDGIIKVTDQGVEEPLPYSKLDRVIWKKSIIERPAPERVNLDDHDFVEFLKAVCNDDPERLLALCTAIGYLMHTHKDETNTKAVFLVDEYSTPEEANGGTGKSLILQAISKLRPSVFFEDGKGYRPEQGRFIFQNVSEEQAVYAIEDITPKFDFSILFNAITGHLVIERKRAQPFQLDFTRAPKIAITTNYLPSTNGGSYKRRMAVYALSDTFSAEFTPLDMFDKPFWSKEWTVKDWNVFDYFMLSCCEQYLSKGLLQQPESDAYKRSVFAASTCPEFVEFCEMLKPNTDYYMKDMVSSIAPYESGLLDGFKLRFGFDHLKQRTFTKWLKFFAKHNDLQYMATDIDNRRNQRIRFSKQE